MAKRELERAYAQLGNEEWAFVKSFMAVYHSQRPLLIFRGERPDIALAHAYLGGDFDLVVLDGDPETGGFPYDAIEELLPFLDESAYLMIHHAAHHRVTARIDQALASHPELIDGGMIGRTAIWDVHHQAHYGGLRLLRYTRTRRLTVWAEATQ